MPAWLLAVLVGGVYAALLVQFLPFPQLVLAVVCHGVLTLIHESIVLQPVPSSLLLPGALASTETKQQEQKETASSSAGKGQEAGGKNKKKAKVPAAQAAHTQKASTVGAVGRGDKKEGKVEGRGGKKEGKIALAEVASKQPLLMAAQPLAKSSIDALRHLHLSREHPEGGEEKRVLG
jgi:hypothetical protein